jgi:hypothetical protein
MAALVSGKERPVVTLLSHQPSLLICVPFERKLNGVRQLEQQVQLVVKRTKKSI